MPQEVFQHTFANGLTLLAEPMPHVRSAALNFLLPAGCVYDRPDRLGAGTVLADLITRGAGDRDSRELTLAMDNLGLDSSESVGSVHMRFWGATVGRNLPAALELYADILLRPHLPEDELDAVRSLALQDIRGLEDEPRAKVMVELRSAITPARSATTTAARPKASRPSPSETFASTISSLFRPGGAILAVAGNIEWAPLKEQVERLFGDWRGDAPTPPAPGQRGEKRGHVAKDLAQTQIAVAYASVPFGDPDYYAAHGRRPRPVRRHEFPPVHGGPRETRPVLLRMGLLPDLQGPGQRHLLRRHHQRARPGDARRAAGRAAAAAGRDRMEEVERVQAGLKSSLIMQQESTSARAWRWRRTGTTSAACAASTRSSRPSTP